ncbi:hypothetical protein KIPB_008654 [Kipferlia bialata]|uniref:Ig-like domain-containing protein n=1 Tax=Kipferlia bialata TaxID=797122 RepID=A0A9K3D0Z6_9EUKA|nr:hypothetical protein KIPB_008654 [Kipferlia bialata]|eukprot:g8654.t1
MMGRLSMPGYCMPGYRLRLWLMSVLCVISYLAQMGMGGEVSSEDFPLLTSETGSPSPDHSSLVLTPGTEMVAGETLSIQCTLADDTGTPIAGGVQLSLRFDTWLVYEDMQPVDGTPGLYSALIERTTSGVLDVGVRVDSESVSFLQQSITVLPGDVCTDSCGYPASALYAVDASFWGSIGACSAVPLYAALYDQYGNPVTGLEDVQVVVDSTPDSSVIGPFLMASEDTPGLYSVTVESAFSEEGSYLLSLTVGGEALPGVSGSFTKSADQGFDTSDVTVGDGTGDHYSSEADMGALWTKFYEFISG